MSTSIARRAAAATLVVAPPVVVERMPLAHYVEPFLRHCERVRELSPHTVRAYRHALMGFVAFAEAVGVSSPERVKARHVEGYTAALREHGASVATCNQHRAALVTLWRWLMGQEVATINPAATAYTIRRPRPIPDYLTLVEQEAVLTELRGLRSLRGRAAFALAATGLLTGLRVAELAALEIAHLRGGLLKVENGKGHKQRLVPVIPWLADVLGRFMADVRPRFAGADRVPFVFVSPTAAMRGEHVAERVLYHIIRRVVSPIVGRSIHPHTLRHSYATRLLTLGADLESLRAVMGHSSLATTQLYLHIPTETVQRKVAGWLTGEPVDDQPIERSILLADPQPALDAAAEAAMREPEPRVSWRARPHPFADVRVQARLRALRRKR